MKAKLKEEREIAKEEKVQRDEKREHELNEARNVRIMKDLLIQEFNAKVEAEMAQEEDEEEEGSPK